MMRAIHKIFLVKIVIIAIIFGVFVAVAIPRYVNMNKHAEASQCRRNQVIVETALALACAESLSVSCKARFPKKLEPSMFDDGVIPTCPVDNTPIAFDTLTGTAYCPHFIPSHQRGNY